MSPVAGTRPPRRGARGAAVVRTVLGRARIRVVERAASLRLAAAAGAAWLAAVLPAAGWLPALGAFLCAGIAACALCIPDRSRNRIRSETPADRRSGRRAVRWAISVALLAAAAAAGVLTARTLVPPEPASLSTEATVITDAVTGPSGAHRAELRTRAGPVTLITHDVPPAAGSRVRVSGRIDPSGGSPVLFPDEPVEVIADPGAPWRVRAAAREFLVRAALGGPGPVAHDGAGLLPGLVVGDTGHLAPGLEDAMRTVSLAHLTAVSGSNISIVAVTVMWTVRRVVARRGWAIGAAVCVTAGYVFVVGPEPSVIRAAAMGLVGAVVLVRGSGTPGTAVLATAVIGVLILRPSLASQAGFHLSVAATAALVLLGPGLTARLYARGVPFPVATALAVPLTAQIGVTPVLLGIGGTMSAWAVPANVLAAPLVAPATLLGILVLGLGVVAALAGTTAGPIALLGGLLAAPAVLCAWWIARLARVAVALPAAVWPWPAGSTGIVLAIGMALGLALAVLVSTRAALVLGAGLLVLCLCAGSLVALGGRRLPPDWQVLVCDVGQGSAALVRLSEDSGLLVDAGPDAAAVDDCLTRAGTERVHLLVSHYDGDHIAGHPGATRGRTLTGIDHPLGAGEHRRAHALRDAHPGVPVTELGAGAAFASGEVQWEILWPRPGAPIAEGDTNAGSAVVLVTAPGLSVLLPGDIGEPEQRRLARTVPPVDVLLAPHHGSADLSPEFFTAAAPRLGVVSVGEDNDYGHPSPASLAAFGPAPVMRTDRCGTVALVAGPAGPQAVPLDPGPGCDR